MFKKSPVAFLEKINHSLGVNFFKPTWKKVLIAFTLTIWPYVASLLFVLFAGEGDIFSDPFVQLSFWFHSWYWSPLYPIIQLIPIFRSNGFWQSNSFYFFVYPLLRFSIRYIFTCFLFFFINKLVKKQSEKRQKTTLLVNTPNN